MFKASAVVVLLLQFSIHCNVHCGVAATFRHHVQLLLTGKNENISVEVKKRLNVRLKNDFRQCE